MLRDGSRRPRRTTSRASAGVLALVCACVVGCMPDVGEDPVPAAMQFDPDSDPARLPEPTLLVVDPETGRIDLGRAGVDVPSDCAEVAAEAVAQCEFDRYLESLDGFPTLTPARAPAGAALDPATLGAAGNIVVVDLSEDAVVSDVSVAFDEEARYVVVEPASGGWAVGHSFAVAVRGYAGGVRAADGRDVVAAPLTFLLKAEESLTCGAATGDAIATDCPWLGLLVEDMSDGEARAALVTLEEQRQRLVDRGAWDAVAARGGVPKAEVAALWVFPIHTAPVVELDPSQGLAPAVTDARTVRLSFQGDVDSATVMPFAPGGDGGNTFLLDLTALEANDFAGGLPAFSASVESADRAIVLETEADLVAGHLYGILLTKTITDTAGRGLVPSPVTVFLRSSGSLVDGDGHATVDGVSDADAAELEAGRTDLTELFDDPLFGTLTGLTRDDLAYVYAWEMEVPQ